MKFIPRVYCNVPEISDPRTPAFPVVCPSVLSILPPLLRRQDLASCLEKQKIIPVELPYSKDGLEPKSESSYTL